MVTGVVLIRLSSGKEKSALSKIKDTKGVSHVSGVYGRWDLICDIEADDLPSMTNVVVNKLRSIPGVTSTETLVTTAI
ncbi:MAG: Lrp/AsnC ligand binding domain-containing protein [Elusimicrobia bacterium]|nr:Lrp/AsnC ligand binding domain-containing protein [Elusimicrobiota bacterium]MBI2916033.1 Lrp/AsnC ligand binding domain-containing protein [Elusimicrobiota bacterium]MBI3012732.1 Lrp/AsnC ligand binding domain-containing protein [Elusimicrobiota bacterium]MBI4217968.1 Lrp/AsnC ligand binding domain-containing protein [Elusimicrobiota bacterium]